MERQSCRGVWLPFCRIYDRKENCVRKYVFDLPEVETYLQDKAQQEQINNQLVTQGRENALEQQPEKEKIAEENIISELEKEPVIEPETVHITFTVAECGEFHTIGVVLEFK